MKGWDIKTNTFQNGVSNEAMGNIYGDGDAHIEAQGDIDNRFGMIFSEQNVFLKTETGDIWLGQYLSEKRESRYITRFGLCNVEYDFFISNGSYIISNKNLSIESFNGSIESKYGKIFSSLDMILSASCSKHCIHLLGTNIKCGGDFRVNAHKMIYNRQANVSWKNLYQWDTDSAYITCATDSSASI